MDLGFSCQPAQKQDTWRNYARTVAAYRPRILTSAPADQRGGRMHWAAGGCWWWADRLGSMSESDKDRGRDGLGEWRSAPSALWFILIFIRVLFTHLLPWGQARKLPLHLCLTHMHTQMQTLQTRTSALTSPQTLPLDNNRKVYMSSRVYFRASKNILFVLVHLIHQGPQRSRHLTKEVQSETQMITLQWQTTEGVLISLKPASRWDQDTQQIPWWWV